LRAVVKVEPTGEEMEMKYGRLLVALTLMALIGCVHTELIWRDFAGETVAIDVRIDADARVDASYYLKVDKDDPVGTVVSIGSSVAKAAQVAAAQQRMDRAIGVLDLSGTIRAELTNHLAKVERMHVVGRGEGADYLLEIEIWRYGIRANDELGGTFFEVHCHTKLYETVSNTVVWDDLSMVQSQIGPDVFGIPAADNVLSAAMLAGLSEDDILTGLSRAAVDVAGKIGDQFSRDLRRARSRR